LGEKYSDSYKLQEDALKNSYEVRIIEETLTKGLINARFFASELEKN
jgi:hypothetical protein